jgi:hypothetical protein
MKATSGPAAPEKLSLQQKLELAQRLFREHYADCFWYMKPDLVVTETNLPSIIEGLRSYGGREEFLHAARLAE